MRTSWWSHEESESLGPCLLSCMQLAIDTTPQGGILRDYLPVVNRRRETTCTLDDSLGVQNSAVDLRLSLLSGNMAASSAMREPQLRSISNTVVENPGHAKSAKLRGLTETIVEHPSIQTSYHLTSPGKSPGLKTIANASRLRPADQKCNTPTTYVATQRKRTADRSWRQRLSGASSTPFPSTMPGSASSASPRSFTAGGVCLVDVTKSQQDIASVVCTAWGIMLSHQARVHDVIMGFRGYGSEEALPIRLDVAPSRCLEDVLRKAGRSIEHASLVNTTLEEVRALGEGAETACSFQTVVDVRVGTDESDDSLHTIDNRAIVLECVLGEELHLSAHFDQRLISRASMQFLLSDLEHVLWQLLDAKPAKMVTKIGEIDLVSPATQRQLLRLNYP